MDQKNITLLLPLGLPKECTRPEVYAPESGFAVLNKRVTRARCDCWQRVTRQGERTQGRQQGGRALGPTRER